MNEVASRCLEMVADDFAQEENWCDLCREAPGMGALSALLVIEPVSLPRADLEQWRKLAKTGLSELEQNQDGELDFQRVYYHNLDQLFAALLERC